MSNDFELGEDYVPYSNEIIERMYNVRIGGMPASFLLLDSRKTKTQSHASSDIMTYVLLESNKMIGTLPDIISLNKTYSWVEDSEYVYDASLGLMWKKDSFYKKYKPVDVYKVSRDEVLTRISDLINKEVTKEMMMAYILDIKYNLIGKEYEDELKDHIKRFKNELSLSESDVDLTKVFDYMFDLKELYKKIEDYEISSVKKDIEGGTK